MADLGKMKFLKRFPDSKHEQIRQVMSYLEMCGLSGRDIVSIGGYMDRRCAAEHYQAARERVQGFIDQKVIRCIGADRGDQIVNRFKYCGITGDYNFYYDYSSTWDVKSVKTGVRKRVSNSDREWPSHVHWNRRHFYDMVLDLADGRINLNF